MAGKLRSYSESLLAPIEADGQYGSAPLHPSPDHCGGYEDGEGDPGTPTTAFTWIPGRNERDRQNEHQTRREDTQGGHLIPTLARKLTEANPRRRNYGRKVAAGY